MQFHNPTHKYKAVKVVGGAVVIPPNGKKTIDGEWSEYEIAKMKAAGLVISGKATPSKKPEDDKDKT